MPKSYHLTKIFHVSHPTFHQILDLATHLLRLRMHRHRKKQYIETLSSDDVLKLAILI